jgi:hypothetical protein
MFPDARQTVAVQPDAFEAWWQSYPHKVCKGQARRAWAPALRKASVEQLMDGVARYIVAKHDDIPWCNPATWLNGERWLDEPATNRRSSDPDLELRAKARTIAAGLPSPSTTRQQAARMVALGLITQDQARRAGF